jgi:hypothetical protein
MYSAQFNFDAYFIFNEVYSRKYLDENTELIQVFKKFVGWVEQCETQLDQEC